MKEGEERMIKGDVPLESDGRREVEHRRGKFFGCLNLVLRESRLDSFSHEL